MDAYSASSCDRSLLESSNMEGDIPVIDYKLLCTECDPRVGLLGNASLSRW
jgi:hypothetical protein